MKDLDAFVYLDNVLVTGKSEQEHLYNLDRVLQCLKENGLRVKKEKCEFNKARIQYLGHVLDEKGVHPAVDKIRAIQEAAPGSNVKQLQAFVGLVKYYGCFVPNQSTVLALLYLLLRYEVTWQWGKEQQDAFNRYSTKRC